MYSFGSPRKHAVRVVISQDHTFKTKQKFFCDGLSEKRVHLKVHKQNMGIVRSISSDRISCQYPILKISDLTQNHSENTGNNSWSIVKPYPTDQEIEKMPPNTPKTYESQLWVRDEENITFHGG